MDYQYKFSTLNPSMLDSRMRSEKAKKIYTVIKDFSLRSNKDLRTAVCLDIGGSAGFAAKALSPHVGSIDVVDIDKQALQYGIHHNPADNITYRVGDAMRLPFGDKYFDIIVCNQVYEHVPNHTTLVSEMFRVLKSDGFCYFGGNNKYMIMEPHYRLPFLSWLPRPIADTYIKTFRGLPRYHETHLSYWGLRKLLSRFQIHDYTIRVIKHAETYTAEISIPKHSYIKRIPDFLLSVLTPVIPGYIFILTK